MTITTLSPAGTALVLEFLRQFDENQAARLWDRLAYQAYLQSLSEDALRVLAVDFLVQYLDAPISRRSALMPLYHELQVECECREPQPEPRKNGGGTGFCFDPDQPSLWLRCLRQARRAAGVGREGD